jgi:hypothetical protein
MGMMKKEDIALIKECLTVFEKELDKLFSMFSEVKEKE